MQKFTFIESNQESMADGMMCDPITGLCGPVQKQEKEEQNRALEEDGDE